MELYESWCPIIAVNGGFILHDKLRYFLPKFAYMLNHTQYRLSRFSQSYKCICREWYCHGRYHFINHYNNCQESTNFVNTYRLRGQYYGCEWELYNHMHRNISHDDVSLCLNKLHRLLCGLD